MILFTLFWAVSCLGIYLMALLKLAEADRLRDEAKLKNEEATRHHEEAKEKNQEAARLYKIALQKNQQASDAYTAVTNLLIQIRESMNSLN